MADEQKWIPELELPDAKVKWAFSHFDGREDTYNAEGDHNFQVIIPNEMVEELVALGWNIREMPPMEEGDPSEYLLKVKISYKYDPPKIFLIKNGKRKIRAALSDIPDITRATTDRIDLIIQPSRYPGRGGQPGGVSAYVKEMYVNIRTSRFAEMYDDMETI